jgi:hypothetical protein
MLTDAHERQRRDLGYSPDGLIPASTFAAWSLQALPSAASRSGYVRLPAGVHAPVLDFPAGPAARLASSVAAGRARREPESELATATTSPTRSSCSRPADRTCGQRDRAGRSTRPLRARVRPARHRRRGPGRRAGERRGGDERVGAVPAGRYACRLRVRPVRPSRSLRHASATRGSFASTWPRTCASGGGLRLRSAIRPRSPLSVWSRWAARLPSTPGTPHDGTWPSVNVVQRVGCSTLTEGQNPS